MGSIGVSSGQVQFGGSGGSSSATSRYDPDSPQAWIDAYGAVSAFDCEFNRTTNPTSLPTNWVSQNPRSGTYLEQLGSGQFTIGTGSNSVNDIACIVQPVSAAASYTAVGKARTHYSLTGGKTGISTGLVLTDGTKAAGIFFNTNPLILLGQWTNIASAFTSNPSTAIMTDTEGSYWNPMYWRIKKNSTTSYDLAYSADGVLWLDLALAYDASAWLTPTHFGFLLRQAGGVNVFALDWFRVR